MSLYIGVASFFLAFGCLHLPAGVMDFDFTRVWKGDAVAVGYTISRGFLCEHRASRTLPTAPPLPCMP